jgi:hypothetical protein
MWTTDPSDQPHDQSHFIVLRYFASRVGLSYGVMQWKGDDCSTSAVRTE